jgi:DNA excision repair protein ERCC-5
MATIGWTPERTDEVLVPVIKDMNRREAEGTQSNITGFFRGATGVGAGFRRGNGRGKRGGGSGGVGGRLEGALGRLKEKGGRGGHVGKRKRGREVEEEDGE